MAYHFYLDGVELPVTPGALQLKINNNNKTITLIDDGEVNILKTTGLSEYSFDALLPSFNYPFNNLNTQQPQYYLNKLEKLKTSMKPFTFSVSRVKPNGEYMFGTSKLVSLEDYTVNEDADKYGFDIMVSIKLKQYREYKTNTFDIKKLDDGSKVAVKNNSRFSLRDTPLTYTVKQGDTLWAIAKKCLNDGSKYKELAKLNSISNPNNLHEGQIIKLC